MMKTLQYRVTFTTPAFLGNAEQSGQWRTPPFKALLRHWWRVAVAESHAHEWKKIREAEGQLFGNAWLDSGTTKSLVRMRLSDWREGSNGWHKLPGIGSKNPVAADLYLGYGPVQYDRRIGTRLAHGSAIQAEGSATVRLAVPEEHEDDIANTLALIDQFGTIGGRSRNGWGSVSLEPQDGTPELAVDAGKFTARLERALQRDWPHAIGCDDRGGLLMWQSEAVANWQKAMTQLAQLRKNLNSTFKTNRHWLNYPVTKHDPKNWGNKRLPSSLRFKVVPASNSKVKALVFHLPCLPPLDFSPNRTELVTMWKRVHEFLDDDQHDIQRKPA